MTNYNTVLPTASELIKSAAEAYNGAVCVDTKRYLKGIISQMVRNLDAYFDSNGHVKWSKAALEKAVELNVDAKLINWKTQTKWDRKREVLHFDHKTTVKDIVEGILRNPSDTQKILNSVEIVWITKEENRVLDKSGYRNTRTDHSAAYVECMIEVVALGQEGIE